MLLAAKLAHWDVCNLCSSLAGDMATRPTALSQNGGPQGGGENQNCQQCAEVPRRKYVNFLVGYGSRSYMYLVNQLNDHERWSTSKALNKHSQLLVNIPTHT